MCSIAVPAVSNGSLASHRGFFPLISPTSIVVSYDCCVVESVIADWREARYMVYLQIWGPVTDY